MTSARLFVESETLAHAVDKCPKRLKHRVDTISIYGERWI